MNYIKIQTHRVPWSPLFIKIKLEVIKPVQITNYEVQIANYKVCLPSTTFLKPSTFPAPTNVQNYQSEPKSQTRDFYPSNTESLREGCGKDDYGKRNFFFWGGGLQFSNSSSIFSFCVGVYRVVQKAWVLSEKKFVCMPWVLSLFYLESCVHPKLLWSRLNWDWTQWSAASPSHQVPLTYYHHYVLMLI